MTHHDLVSINFSASYTFNLFPFPLGNSLSIVRHRLSSEHKEASCVSRNGEEWSIARFFVVLLCDPALSLYFISQTVCALCMWCIHCTKTRSESFAFCRGRANISGGSKTAWINVDCNGNSLSVAVPSKVKKCLRACATPVIPPWQIRCKEATEEIQKESKLQPCPRTYSSFSSCTQPMAVRIISN